MGLALELLSALTHENASTAGIDQNSFSNVSLSNPLKQYSSLNLTRVYLQSCKIHNLSIITPHHSLSSSSLLKTSQKMSWL